MVSIDSGYPRMLLALALEYYIYVYIYYRYETPLRARFSSVGGRNWMGADEEKNMAEVFSRKKKCKARTVAERGKRRACYVTPDLSYD